MRLLRHGLAGLSHTGNCQWAAKLAHVGLVQTAFQQRAAHPMLPRGGHAGAIIAGIVEVGAVEDHFDGEPLRQTFQLRVKLRLAVIAAVRSVLEIVRIGELLRVDHFVANADQLGDARALRPAPLPPDWRWRRSRPRPLAQRQLGRLGHHRAIHAAGEGDGAARVAADEAQEPVALSSRFLSTRLYDDADIALLSDHEKGCRPAYGRTAPRSVRPGAKNESLHRNAVAMRI